MNKTQLVDELSSRFEGNKKAAAQALEAVVDTITRTVAKGEKVAITGFGVFEKIDKPARFARNPATGERVRVKKTSVPRFKAGTSFKDVVSGAKKLPKLTATRGRAAATTATKASARVTGAGRAAAGTARERTAATAKKAPGGAATTAQPAAPKTTSAKKAAAKSTGTKKTATAQQNATSAPSTGGSGAGRASARTSTP
jgi:DNA-binding protein HU-beta